VSERAPDPFRPDGEDVPAQPSAGRNLGVLLGVALLVLLVIVVIWAVAR
jgi:hypothetical protein